MMVKQISDNSNVKQVVKNDRIVRLVSLSQIY